MLKKVPFLLFALAGFIICGCGTKPQEAAPVADIIVETIKPSAAEFRESFTEQAVTRLSKTYTVTMPMEGRIGRIELELGSAVKAGQKIATLDRAPLELAVAEIGATVAELESAIELSRHKKLEESVLASARLLQTLSRRSKPQTRRLPPKKPFMTVMPNRSKTTLTLFIQAFCRRANWKNLR